MLKKLFTKGNASEHEAAMPRDEALEAFGKTAQKWNLEEIQSYVRGQMPGHETEDIGLAYILHRFNTHMINDKNFPGGKRREFEVSDRNERTKKGFDIVLSIAANKNLDPASLDLIDQFSTVYKDVIEAFDNEMAQTYGHKLKEAYKNAQIAALAKSKIKRELSIRYE